MRYSQIGLAFVCSRASPASRSGLCVLDLVQVSIRHCNGIAQIISKSSHHFPLPLSIQTMPGRLKVRRPSPTTVSFTVSNAPQRSNSPAKILFGLQILLRAALFFCVIGAGIARLRHTFFYEDGRVIGWPAVWSSPLGAKVCSLVDLYNPLAMVAVGVLVIYCVFKRTYTGRLKIAS
jgi:hypothetical protein